jgi:phytoene dehydrogenase-like protein
VHSATASLAPAGAAVIHVAKYLDTSTVTDPKADEQELESFLDMLQPGWRSEAVVRRFLPSMTVTNAVVTAARGGLKGRPPVDVRDVPGLYLAGDWVGAHGTLGNAAVASAARAARLLIDRTPNPDPGPRIPDPGLRNVEPAGAVA